MNPNDVVDPNQLLVIHGQAEDEEVAAVLAALVTTAGRSEGAAEPHDRADTTGTAGIAGTWADRAGLIGQPARPGPGGWRSSARPR